MKITEIPLIPLAASHLARQVDQISTFLLVLFGIIIFGIVSALIFFCVRYREGSSANRNVRTQGQWKLEVLWTFIPLGIFMGLFVWGARVYFEMHSVPANATEIYVTGKQWMWKFQHANGTRELGQLHVPVNQPVKLIMTSEDVIHSIFIPAFRMKQDVLPDRYTSTWFQATQPGTYPLFCTQYCGTFHATMGGQVIVLSAADFQKWEAQSKTPGANGVAANPPSRGEKLFARYGCTSCHGAGSAVPAPSLGGLFGRKVLLASGESLIADENYIQESILNPAAKLVSGYQNTMPSFRGQIPVEELTDLVTYIKSLKSKVTHE